MSDDHIIEAGYLLEADDTGVTVVAAIGDETGVQAAGAVVTDYHSAVIVAAFNDTGSAEAAYERLKSAESNGSLGIEGLIPAALAGCTVDEFMARLPELDAPMKARLDAARAAGQVLRYVASLDAATGKASVGLVQLDRSHPFANINLTDNVVRFVTSRYDVNPLVVQGPGAGPQVTAGGVFADLLRVCAYLGARI